VFVLLTTSPLANQGLASLQAASSIASPMVSGAAWLNEAAYSSVLNESTTSPLPAGADFLSKLSNARLRLPRKDPSGLRLALESDTWLMSAGKHDGA
jgi:hypothetical protein